MADGVDFKITGGPELERGMLELAEDVGPRKARTTLNKPMKEAMQIIADDIEQNTREDSGELKRSVDVKARSPKKQELRNGTVSSDAVIVGTAGWYGKKIGKSVWFQGLSEEKGTQFKPPQNTLKNALNSKGPQAVNQFMSDVWKFIEKRAARFAKTGK